MFFDFVPNEAQASAAVYGSTGELSGRVGDPLERTGEREVEGEGRSAKFGSCLRNEIRNKGNLIFAADSTGDMLT